MGLDCSICSMRSNEEPERIEPTSSSSTQWITCRSWRGGVRRGGAEERRRRRGEAEDERRRRGGGAEKERRRGGADDLSLVRRVEVG